MDKPTLIEKLDRALDKATILSIQRGMPIPLSKKLNLIGNLCVEKNDDGFYDVITLDRKVLFENLSGFDVAVIIAQRHVSGDTKAIQEVLELEEKFSKYRTDMVYYLHCMKKAKKVKDDERLAILEDKFQTAELMARGVKDKLGIFKRVKYTV